MKPDEQQTLRRRLSLLASISDLLADITRSSRAEAAFLLSPADQAQQRVVLGATNDHFQPFEPVRLSMGPGRRVTLGSRMRPWVTSAPEAVVVRTGATDSAVLVLFGVSRFEATAPVAETAMADWWRRTDQIRLRDVDRAYRLVAEAAASLLNPDHVADLVLLGARRLTGSDAAYLALPVDDHNYAFSRTAGLRTATFRTLRVGPAQGIGSIASERGIPVRSLNYNSDPRFSRQMHEVTRREGIYSAMAIPVLDHNAVAAILYVANHAPLAYHQTDERVLQDFAEAINLSLQATMSREELLEAGRQAERQALGRHLHDRLGRHVSQLSRLVAAQPDQPAGGALAEVSAVVAELARSLREDIDSLMGGAEPPLLSPAEVAAEICRVPSIAGLRRIVQVRGRPGESEYDPVLPANVSEALRRVGQEAVFNAELHSNGTSCTVTLQFVDDKWSLTIRDDGSGFGAKAPETGHFGLQLMRQAAQDAGGRVEIHGDQNGVQVECTIPVAR